MDNNALSSIKVEAMATAFPVDIIDMIQRAYDLGRKSGRDEAFQQIAADMPNFFKESKNKLPPTDDEISPNDSISVLNLPVRLYNTLTGYPNYIQTINDMTMLSKDDLKKIEGVGDVFIKNIEDSLSATSYRLRPS